MRATNRVLPAMSKVCNRRSCTRTHDTKFKACPVCRERARRAVSKRKRERKAQHVPPGQRMCTQCTRVQLNSQFQPAHARRTELTARCLKCRNSQRRTQRNPNTIVGRCRQVWFDWKERNTCARCGTHKHIESDHPKGSKVHMCSDYSWWSNHGGPEAQRRELAKCTPLCRFCHRKKSAEERGTITLASQLWKQDIVDKEKRRVGACEYCKLDVTPDTVMCFDWAHKDRATRTICISHLVRKSNAYFLKHWPIERPKCRMLCCMCHKDDTDEENRSIQLQAQRQQQ